MAGITIHEFGVLVAASKEAAPIHATDDWRAVPPEVFVWLEAQALRSAEPKSGSCREAMT